MNGSPLEIARVAEGSEVEFTAETLAAAPHSALHSLGMGVRRLGRALATWCATVDVLGYNRILGVGLEDPIEDLDALVEPFVAAQAPRFMIQVSPPAESALAPELARRGFSPLNRWAKLHRRVEPIPVPPTRLRLGSVEPDRAQESAAIVAAAFQHDPRIAAWLAALVGRRGWHHLAAWDGDRMVATGAMFVRGDIVHLGLAGTLESHRGLGAQSALIAHALGLAAARGGRWAITETAEDKPEKPAPSFRNLVRLGFELTYLRPNWVRILQPPKS